MNGFVIKDAEIDTTALVRRIEEGLAHRRNRAAELGIDFEAMAGLQSVDGPAHWLALTRLSCQAVHVQPDHFDASLRLWRHPLGWLRQQARVLVTYYVNRLSARQGVFNVGMMHLLEDTMAAKDAEIRDLKAQVIALRDRLQDLEQLRK